jgi:hypothetical protein
MISNENLLYYKVVDSIKNYNFDKDHVNIIDCLKFLKFLI